MKNSPRDLFSLFTNYIAMPLAFASVLISMYFVVHQHQFTGHSWLFLPLCFAIFLGIIIYTTGGSKKTITKRLAISSLVYVTFICSTVTLGGYFDANYMKRHNLTVCIDDESNIYKPGQSFWYPHLLPTYFLSCFHENQRYFLFDSCDSSGPCYFGSTVNLALKFHGEDPLTMLKDDFHLYSSNRGYFFQFSQEFKASDQVEKCINTITAQHPFGMDPRSSSRLIGCESKIDNIEISSTLNINNNQEIMDACNLSQYELSWDCFEMSFADDQFCHGSESAGKPSPLLFRGPYATRTNKSTSLSPGSLSTD